MKAPTIKIKLADKNNYGGQRNTKQICYIAIHATANDGDSDEGNAAYFSRPHNPKSSAHYFVDDDSVTQSVPDNYIAYSVGGSKYTDCAKTGGGKLYCKATNANTINIEMCDSQKDGVVMAQDATIERTISLVRWLMDKYNIDIDHVIRHFDVNGKHCPVYLMNWQAWAEFKARILGYQIGRTYKTTKPCYLRVSYGTGSNKVLYEALSQSSQQLRAKCKPFDGYVKFNGTFILTEVKVVGNNIWGRIKSGYWVPLKYKGIDRVRIE